MDAFSEIKKILSESSDGDAKKKQEQNARANPSSGSSSPEQKSTEVLKAPGYDEVSKAGDATGKATAPENDSKAKSSSSKTSLKQEEKEAPFGKKVLKEPEEDKDEESDDEEESDEKSEKKDKKKKKDDEDMKEAVFDVDRHIQAMFNDENALSEEFKGKAKTIFEAALSERESVLREQLESEYETKLQESVDQVKNELTEQVDSYLGYIAENWLEENRVAVETGLKQEITESLLEGIRSVFLEHNIEVPESKVDLVEELTSRVEELESKLNDEINNNVELSNQLDVFKKNQIVAELGEDLSNSQFDKFVTLCEGVSADSDEEYTNKLKTIKEGYFKKSSDSTKPESKDSKTVLSEAITGDELEPSTVNDGQTLTEEAISPEMKVYANTLSRMKRS